MMSRRHGHRRDTIVLSVERDSYSGSALLALQACSATTATPLTEGSATVCR
jgi:hypothetical protein